MKPRVILTITVFILSMVWAEESTYASPADGATNGDTANEETHTPPGGVKSSTSQLKAVGVRLLDAQDKFERNIDVKKLAKFIKTMDSVLERNTTSFKLGTKLLVQVTMSPDKGPAFKIAYQGEVSKKSLQAMYDALKKNLHIRTRKDRLKFECEYEIIKK